MRKQCSEVIKKGRNCVLQQVKICPSFCLDFLSKCFLTAGVEYYSLQKYHVDRKLGGGGGGPS